MFDLENEIGAWRRRMLGRAIKSPEPLDELENHLRDDIERQMQSGLSAEHAFRAAAQRLGEPRALQTEFEKNRGVPWRALYIPIGMIFTALVAAFGIFLEGDYRTEDATSLIAISLVQLALVSLILPLMSGFKAQDSRTRAGISLRTVWAAQLFLGVGGLFLALSRDASGAVLIVASCLMFATLRRLQIRPAVAWSIGLASVASAVATRMLFWRPAIVHTDFGAQVWGLLAIGLGVSLMCSWPLTYRFLPSIAQKMVRMRIQLALAASLAAIVVITCGLISGFFRLRPDSQWIVALVWTMMIPLGVFGSVAFGLEEAARRRVAVD